MSNQNTETVTDASRPNAIARISWKEEGVDKEILVTGTGLTIGRSTQNDLVITDLAASRFHCKFLPEDAALKLVDLDSTNGTFLNGERVVGNHLIQNGDKVRIGEMVFEIEVFPTQPEEEAPKEGMAELALEKTFIVPAPVDFPWLAISLGTGRGTTILLDKKRMQIGRASRNKQWDIDLVDRAVSRPHAEISQVGDQWILTDLGSANGTMLNGKEVHEPQVLKDGDALGIGDTVLIYHSKKGA